MELLSASDKATILDTAEGLNCIGSVCFIIYSLFASGASLYLDGLIKNVENVENESLCRMLFPSNPLIRPVVYQNLWFKVNAWFVNC